MLQAREAEAKGALGGRGRPKKEDEKHYQIMISHQGTSSDYLLRRLLRDAPEFVARYEKGEFPSVRQAAKLATLQHGSNRFEAKVDSSNDPSTSVEHRRK